MELKCRLKHQVRIFTNVQKKILLTTTMNKVFTPIWLNKKNINTFVSIEVTQVS